MDPPLPIPNREVKRTHADGTAPPGGRVGSRRSLVSLMSFDIGDTFFVPRHKNKERRLPASVRGSAPKVPRRCLAPEVASLRAVVATSGAPEPRGQVSALKCLPIN